MVWRSLSRSYASSSIASPPSVRTNAVLSLSVLLAAAGAWYYDTLRSSRRAQTAPGGTPIETSDAIGGKFKISIRTSRGVQDHFFTRMSEGKTEKMLRENEDGQLIARKGDPVVRWDRNWLGSNEPCEDRSAVDLIARSRGVEGRAAEGEEGKNDLMLFSIIDGHGGDATSRLLAKTLHPTLSLGLAGLQAGVVPTPEGSLRVLLEYVNPLQWISARKMWNTDSVIASLRNSFLQLDENICQTPIQLLPTLTTLPSTDAKLDATATFPTPGQVFTIMSEPAKAGACAISTVVDAEHNDLYVALAGDCRAVAGWTGADGRWRCDVLSEDQMGENPREVERIRSEHPAAERETVIQQGRIQGGLQPTRAFGDAIYKWTRSHWEAVRNAYTREGMRFRTQRPNNPTPPYVTADPVVTHRKLNSYPGETLKFIVMATDGLWDRITSEEATLLVASYLGHSTHPDVPKRTLPLLFPMHAPSRPRPYPAEDLPGTPERSDGSWVFEGDSNAATHLIRNSLAGGDRKWRGELLSMRGPTTRWMRDDITVTVVFFADAGASQ